MTRFQSVLITGASSGIGAALARACAAPGVILHLAGRDPARLESVAAACQMKGAEAKPHLCDVQDALAMRAWIAAAGALDLVVANAGVSAGTGKGTGAAETDAQVRTLFGINLDGMLNTVLPALDAMARQPEASDGVRGRIAVVASIAAFVAAPGAASYCASKAAVDAWTVATAHGAAARGIVLSSVCPGYIRTAMTADNPFPMPGLMDADRAASIILRGVARGRRRIAFPWWMAAASRGVGLLPPRWSAALLAAPPQKASLPIAR